MEREDIQGMVNLAVSQFKELNVERLSKIESLVEALTKRVIGIDGNGTGKIGVLQKQDIKLEELGENQNRIENKIDDLRFATENFSKKKFWSILKWAVTTIIALLVLILGFMVYRAQQVPAHGVSAIHIPAQTTDASTDGR